MLVDLNPLVGKEEVLRVMWKYGVPARHIRGERLLKLCSELKLVLWNTYSRKKGPNKFIYRRIHHGMLVER